MQQMLQNDIFFLTSWYRRETAFPSSKIFRPSLFGSVNISVVNRLTFPYLLNRSRLCFIFVLNILSFRCCLQSLRLSFMLKIFNSSLRSSSLTHVHHRSKISFYSLGFQLSSNSLPRNNTGNAATFKTSILSLGVFHSIVKNSEDKNKISH